MIVRLMFISVIFLAIGALVLIFSLILILATGNPTTAESAENEVQIISQHVEGYGECEFALWDKYGVTEGDNQLVFIGCSEPSQQETTEDRLVISTKNTLYSGNCTFALWDEYPASTGDNQMVLIGCK